MEISLLYSVSILMLISAVLCGIIYIRSFPKLSGDFINEHTYHFCFFLGWQLLFLLSQKELEAFIFTALNVCLLTTTVQKVCGSSKVCWAQYSFGILPSRLGKHTPLQPDQILHAEEPGSENAPITTPGHEQMSLAP